jgi:molecular chaperone GrpE
MSKENTGEAPIQNPITQDATISGSTLNNTQNTAPNAVPDDLLNGSEMAKIAELEAALAEAKASVLYVKAEGENIRRRAMDDIDKARKFALEKFSSEMLAVKDSLDAALLIEATDVQSYKDGVELTAKQLLNVFDKFNIAEVNPVGEKFDPNKHQAISALESDQEPNTVLTVLQKGYTLNERVLRPALVMVAKAK